MPENNELIVRFANDEAEIQNLPAPNMQIRCKKCIEDLCSILLGIMLGILIGGCYLIVADILTNMKDGMDDYDNYNHYFKNTSSEPAFNASINSTLAP